MKTPLLVLLLMLSMSYLPIMTMDQDHSDFVLISPLAFSQFTTEIVRLLTLYSLARVRAEPLILKETLD